MPEADGQSLERLVARTGNSDPTVRASSPRCRVRSRAREDARCGADGARHRRQRQPDGNASACASLHVADVTAAPRRPRTPRCGSPVQGRADEPRPARSRRGGPRPHLDRGHRRRDPAHSARSERRWNARPRARDRNASRRRRRADAAAADDGPAVLGISVGDFVARPRPTARLASTIRRSSPIASSPPSTCSTGNSIRSRSRRSSC
jgi:hypothetical protein